ncbi:AcrR family transcriptional regulator [Clostridium acetobutylicum]|uniref:Transcriptional regulator, AcrR family n=1 Tax=Clostridium acetobutylicum (strain ATCC 824 / DSM 792 / JCM 1419 / IAM 19013 / LMG 5710 / NBRC 13948 / NRRL B-527 / VKM B-1787 / 2291 / W) TaxID=272562 RepID=Q97N19_CLOAB|nr:MULTISPECIES: TetR/AcrR family transcriptional regulator [Clostridium]AAK78006.1 Transcriptional regulator, AcrR family [Clostridium acetobutylicum ATCC 824]ADZ19062.1 Transcriptional regulator, AcrR family [Clostridium acetobutylicum EA 2018]AEI34689.1 AcrR family transcriptional regulator [Clostridium acetobutylicum DSM 1731]AWV81931.1 TetR/AcrR family transcriptional regulator [Clostridium acetobutylicum]MBC2395481.1 TetR/AcrR family transcriptional regulator [Clostridium acetobutylicum]
MDKEVRKPQQKRSIEKKKRILDAANTLLLKNGYYDITTADIAKAAGLSTGTVYAYFKDKKDILLSSLYESSKSFREQTLNELDKISQNDNPVNTIKNVLQIFIKFHTSYPKKYHDELMSLSYIDEDVRGFFENIKNTMMDAVVKHLKKCGINLKHEKEQSFLIYSLIENIEDELVFDIYPDLNKNILIDECARVIVNMIMD